MKKEDKMYKIKKSNDTIKIEVVKDLRLINSSSCRNKNEIFSFIKRNGGDGRDDIFWYANDKDYATEFLALLFIDLEKEYAK